MARHSHSAKRITLISALVNFLMSIIKIVGGFFTYSYALIMDGIHSFSDLLTDLLVLFIIRYSHHDPDVEHPYGHERFETLGTVILGSLLIATAGILTYDSVLRLIQQETLPLPTWPALVIAAVSIIVKEWLFRAIMSTGKHLQSDLLIANAWHSRSDAFAAIVVFIGVGGALLGISWLDTVAALIVIGIIGKIGWDLAWQSVLELVDTALPPEKTEAMRKSILSINGVRNVHSLRTRKMGAKILLDIHIQVAPDISVSEGHQIGAWVTKKLLTEFTDIHDVIFHVDAEDDGSEELNYDQQALLPLRNEVLTILQQHWQAIPATEDIKHIHLHYLNNRVRVEVLMPSDLLKSPIHDYNQFRHALAQATQDLPWVHSISVRYGE